MRPRARRPHDASINA